MAYNKRLKLQISFWSIFLIAIFSLSFFFRFHGLKNNYPFWVDEFFTVSQANVFVKYGLSAFTNPRVYIEYHNIIPHLLVALFFQVFHQSELIARLPFVVIGSLVPVAVFFLAKKLFDNITAISASLLSTFSYLEIVWSRQARGYVLQQLLVIGFFYFYLHLLSGKKIPKKYYIFLFVIGILGALTHTTFYLLIFAVIFHQLLISPQVILLLKKPAAYISLFIFFSLITVTGTHQAVVNFLKSGTFGANNLWYYHSFLWREYGLITFLTLTGIIFALIKKWRETSALLLYLIFYLLFLNFIFKPYISRYLVVLFPLLYLFTAYTLSQISQHTADLITKHPKINHSLYVLCFTFYVLLFISNGHKFVNRPKQYYSLNHDFREIANIDYHAVYRLVKDKLSNTNSPVPIIETLPDRAQWYLGYDYQPVYLFRWGNETGWVNGLSKQTQFTVNAQGEKFLANTDLKLVTELQDLKKIMKKYPHGFIFIDDQSMDRGIIDYAEKNLKKELYLDHYPLDDNPYSRWPATLYSWGIE